MITVTPETSYKIVHRSQNTLFCEHGNGGVCRDENGVLYAVASGMRMQQIDPFGTLCTSAVTAALSGRLLSSFANPIRMIAIPPSCIWETVS